MCRSSIFNFDTLQTRGILSFDRGMALFTALLIVCAAEGTARVALYQTGDYWEYWDREAADKYLWYRKLAQEGSTPDILIIGDSTAARDFVPSELQAICDASVYNLGWPGNFPLSLEHSTLPILDEPYHPPSIVLFSVSPKSFTSHQLNDLFESSILASAVARHNRGETMIADVVYLARLNAAREFMGSWFSGRGLFQAPVEQGAMLLEDRDLEPRAIGSSYDAFNDGGLSVQRMNVLRKLITLAEARQFQLYVIIPPRDLSDRRLLEAKFLAGVHSMMNSNLAHVLDYRSPSFLKPEHFYDPIHLNRNGATLFSREVAAHILPRIVSTSKARALR